MKKKNKKKKSNGDIISNCPTYFFNANCFCVLSAFMKNKWLTWVKYLHAASHLQYTKVNGEIYKTWIQRGDYWFSSRSARMGKHELQVTFAAQGRTPAQKRRMNAFQRPRRKERKHIALITLGWGSGGSSSSSSSFVLKQKRSQTWSIDGTLYLEQAT